MKRILVVTLLVSTIGCMASTPSRYYVPPTTQRVVPDTYVPSATTRGTLKWNPYLKRYEIEYTTTPNQRLGIAETMQSVWDSMPPVKSGAQVAMETIRRHEELEAQKRASRQEIHIYHHAPKPKPNINPEAAEARRQAARKQLLRRYGIEVKD
jgi:hypothetical protein